MPTVGPVVLSHVLALLAAVSNAVSNVANRKATQEEPARDQFRFRLFLDLLRHRTWLLAVAVMLLSFALSATALGTGQLATVQIIVILELPITLIGGAWVLGSQLGVREWLAIAAMTSGVIGVLACLDPRSGPVETRAPLYWILGITANAGAVLVLFLIARAASHPGAQAALLGAACGLSYGLASALTKGMTEHFARGGVVGALASWQLYAAGVAGVAATWLLENAYHAGRLTAAQPGITLLDPAVATVWGVLVFGEHVRGGAFAALAVLPLLLLATGVIMLSRSPGLRATAGPGADVAGTGHGPITAQRRPGGVAGDTDAPAGGQ